MQPIDTSKRDRWAFRSGCNHECQSNYIPLTLSLLSLLMILYKCALTVNSRIIKLFLEHHNSNYVPLSTNLRLQVLPSISHLPTCQKHHFGAFIQDQSLLVVWDDEPKSLLERAGNIERSLMKVIWHYDDEEETPSDSKDAPVVTIANVGNGEVTSGELEESTMVQDRPTLLINSIVVGLTLTLLTAALGAGWRNLAQEFSIDGSFMRLALVAATPVQVFVGLVSHLYERSFEALLTNNSSFSCKSAL
jgi:hypothetical protein